jgi:hypothetical protein
MGWAYIWSRSPAGIVLKEGDSKGRIISMFSGCREADASSIIVILRLWTFKERAGEGNYFIRNEVCA